MNKGDPISTARDEAERKAWDSLSRYKFQMFGYHAALWVTLNRMCAVPRANPFTSLVKCAKEIKQKEEKRD